MKIFHRYLVLAFIISVLVGCSAAPPSVKEEPAQSEAVSAPAPVVEPEPKETMPSVQQEPAKSAVPLNRLSLSRKLLFGKRSRLRRRKSPP